MNIKIKTILCIVAMAFVVPVVSKAQSFVKGTQVIGAGLGLGSSVWATNSSGRPAISVNYEKGIWEIGGPGVISLGGYLGNTGWKYSASAGGYTFTQKANYTIIGARSAYHYGGLNNDKFDLYGGLMLSYNIVNYSYEDNDPGNFTYGVAAASSGLGLTGFVGGRYYFSDNLGVFAELGYGISTLNLGISYKF